MKSTKLSKKPTRSRKRGSDPTLPKSAAGIAMPTADTLFKVPVFRKGQEIALKELEPTLPPPLKLSDLLKLVEQVPKLRAPALIDIKLPVLSPVVGMDVPGVEPEPVYDAKARDDIQGNIVPGFNKPHQHFMFLRIGKVPRAKEFLRWIAPRISSMEEVLAFRRLFRAASLKLGKEATYLCATWINIAFTPRVRMT
jgi:hypothetical protein